MADLLQSHMSDMHVWCAWPATASTAIHRIETKNIIDSALSPSPIDEDVKI